MKYTMVVLSMFFTPYTLSMEIRSINIKNTTNQTVLIAYREPACAVIEKLGPYQSLMLSSTTSFLAVKYYGQIQKFPMQHRRHCFIIETAKSRYKDELSIREYDDRYVVRSKNDYLYDDPIFQ